MVRLTGVAVAVGVGAAWLGFLTIWFAFGSAGLIACAVLAVVVVGSVLTLRAMIHGSQRHKAAAEVARWHGFLDQFPVQVRGALTILHDDEAACAAWVSAGLGIAARRTTQTYTPGAWPRVAWERRRPPRPDCPRCAATGWAREAGGASVECRCTAAVRESPAGVEIDVIPQPGLTPAHFAKSVAGLPWALGVPEVKVVGGDPVAGTVTLELRFRDPVAAVVTAPRPEEPVNLYAVRLGVRSNGEPWREALMERNWLVAGSMGSGKSGVIRAMVLATAPAARDGYVRNLGIDLKFKIEMRQMRGLVHEIAGTPTEARAMLERLLAIVKERGEAMEAAGVDKHVPTPDAPFWNCIIDELAELLDDPEARKDILSLLRHIMRPGRALGVSVTAFTPTPISRSSPLTRTPDHPHPRNATTCTSAPVGGSGR
jgi:FtsK/SpoIIIE family